MQIVNYLGKVFLCLILARNIREAYAAARRYIYLCVALAHSESHRIRSARLIHHLFSHILTEHCEYDYRQNKGQQKAEQGRGLLLYITREFCAAFVQTLGERRVVHLAGLVYLCLVLVGEYYLGVVYFDSADIFLLYHLHKGAVVDLLYLCVHQQGRNDRIEDQYYKQYYSVIVYQRFFR